MKQLFDYALRGQTKSKQFGLGCFLKESHSIFMMEWLSLFFLRPSTAEAIAEAQDRNLPTKPKISFPE